MIFNLFVKFNETREGLKVPIHLGEGNKILNVTTVEKESKTQLKSI